MTKPLFVIYSTVGQHNFLDNLHEQRSQPTEMTKPLYHISLQ
jgi:hypothetical protein